MALALTAFVAGMLDPSDALGLLAAGLGIEADAVAAGTTTVVADADAATDVAGFGAWPMAGIVDSIFVTRPD